jgi:hypothetical protein
VTEYTFIHEKIFLKDKAVNITTNSPGKGEIPEETMNITKLITLSGIFVLITTPFGCASTPQREGFGEWIDDSLITTKVKTALLGDSAVSGLDIHVETFKGRVHLNGLVDSITEVSKAEELVRDVKGVVLVKNNITVK